MSSTRRSHGRQYHHATCRVCDYDRTGANPSVLAGAQRHTASTGHTTEVDSVNCTIYEQVETGTQPAGGR